VVAGCFVGALTGHLHEEVNMKKKSVDLNCDLGESFGTYHLGQDERIMGFISSANIACGFHAGDPHVMRSTVALAKKKVSLKQKE